MTGKQHAIWGDAYSELRELLATRQVYLAVDKQTSSNYPDYAVVRVTIPYTGKASKRG